MASEIRANSITSRAGLSTVTMTDSGPMFSGITTFVDNSGFTFGVGGGTSIFTPATNILTLGTNNTEKVRIDANGNANITGVTTAANFKTGVSNLHDVGLTLSGGQIDVGSNIKIGTAGVVTATSFVGSGANLTGITQTTINNNATTKFITGTNNANELDCEANLSYNNSLVTFASSSLLVSKSTSPTISVKETAGNKEGAFRANTDGVLIRSLGNYPLIFHTNQTERAQIDGSGRFLIGTNSVYNANSYSNNLIIYENGDAGASIIGNASNSNYASLYLTDTSTAIKGYLEAQLGVNGNFTIGANGTGPIRFTNNGAERLRIDGNGRLQVNMTSNVTGTAKLEVMGTGDTTYPQYSYAIGVADSNAYNSANGAGMGIGFSYKHNSAGSYALGCGIRGFKENTTDGNYAGAMAFYTRPHGSGASEGMRLTSGGQLLIGATTPHDDELLRVHEGGTENELANFRCSNSSHAKTMISMIHMGSGDKVFFSFRRGGSLTQVGRILTSASSTTYQTSSDYRLKENVTAISDGITRLKTLKPYRFNFKIDPDKTVDGFFAHEVTAVPEAISGTKDEVETTYYKNSDDIPEGKAVGDVKDTASPVYQGIDHGKLVPLLTAALQEAITRIETLEQDNIALRARVTNLEGN